VRIPLFCLIAFAGLAFTSYAPLPQDTSPPWQSSETNRLPVTSAPVVAPAFDGSFPACVLHGAAVFWAASTHGVPKTLWVYKVVPQHFPFAAISNLMALGSFTFKDEQRGHRDISPTNEDTLFFFDKKRGCNLTIIPSRGEITYWDDSARPNHWDKIRHENEPVLGVPDEATAQKLGLKFLRQFGIRPADLAQIGHGHLLTFGKKQTRSYFDRATGKYIENEVTSCGVFFNRRLDGINFAGTGIGGGAEIDYSNHAKLAEFRLLWRNVQPFERHAIATPDEILQWIRDGKAVMTHKNPVNPGDVKKLTITAISPLYMGASGDETQDFVYPFAQLEAVADLGGTNVNIQLYCPILSVSKPPAIH
jgi:hypothetical protein